MDWGYVAVHLSPIVAIALATFLYAGIGTWVWNRRHATKPESVQRKAA